MKVKAGLGHQRLLCVFACHSSPAFGPLHLFFLNDIMVVDSDQIILNIWHEKNLSLLHILCFTKIKNVKACLSDKTSLNKYIKIRNSQILFIQ